MLTEKPYVRHSLSLADVIGLRRSLFRNSADFFMSVPFLAIERCQCIGNYV
jgi:hypothetical protein